MYMFLVWTLSNACSILKKTKMIEEDHLGCQTTLNKLVNALFSQAGCSTNGLAILHVAQNETNMRLVRYN